MIDRGAVPSISSVLPRLDVPVGRRGRTQCPIHRGDNHQAFAYDDRKRVWHCFRCGVGGDVIRLVELCLSTDFQGALRWLGLESGEAPMPDPEAAKRRLQAALETRKLIARERELRKLYLSRTILADYAKDRLALNQDDEIAWEILHIAYCNGPPLEAVEDELDELLALIPTEAYRRWTK